MTKLFYIFIFFCLPPSMACAQESVTVENAIYIDLGGIGGFGSLNYSRKFYSINKFNFDGHIGISTTKFKDFQTKFNPQVIIPFGIHGSFGINHHVEIGIGSAYVSSVRANDNFDPKRVSTLNGNASIGYKFQKQKGGFLFRAYYSPIFEQFNKLRHWGGLSVGYAF